MDRFFLLAALVLGATTSPAARAADALATGGGHSCVVQPDGRTYCWGWQEQGQVGDGSFEYSIATPRLITGAHGAVAIDAGYQHTCAVMAGGGVKCWGYDRFGQVGDGAASNAVAPRDVIGVSNAVDVGTGVYFSCALIDDGTVKCWGHGYHYQLGTETLVELHEAGEAAKNVSGATALAVGGEFACVIVEGKVKCWGRNDTSQLGRGTVDPDPGVMQVADVAGLSNVIDITAGYNHACALVEGGAVMCWGNGGRGKLGNDSDATRATPVAVQNLGGEAVAIDAGDYQTCAVLASGAMQCWGYNFQGTLGNGSTADSFVASTVIGIGDVSAFGTGGPHTCARTRIDPLEVWCWGSGSFGQLGNGQIGGHVQATTPVRVTGAGFDTVFGGKAGAFEGP